jgi:putative ABC transport system permease protein
MTVLLSTIALGLVLALVGYGVYLSFRVLQFPDLTVDGSFTLGAATAAALMLAGWDPFAATAVAAAAGALAGLATALMATRLGIEGILAGILSMTALYSINLRVMGRSNLGLVGTPTIYSPADTLVRSIAGGPDAIILGQAVPTDVVAQVVTAGVIAGATALVLWWFLRTELGSALRAGGDNPRMIRALGVSHEWLVTLGLMLGNALVAVGGAAFAQLNAFADASMGIGIVVIGLASVIIGRALVGSGAGLPVLLASVLVGSVLFRMLVAIAIRTGLEPNDLRLITAVVVLVVLVVPGLFTRLTGSRLVALRRKEAPRAAA